MYQYGLLGRKLSHSISPRIHTMLCGYDYVLIEKEPEELDSFFESKDFCGLNVTIPYKKDVIKYCDELSDTAKKIGSVNTIVKKTDGTLYGDNADYFGFMYMLKKSGTDVRGKTALVLGTGGASLTVNAVLRDEGAKEIIQVSRSGKINYQNVYEFSSADVIINTTPVGMYPDNGKRIVDISRFGNLSCVLDLIYNPSLTPILYDAKNLSINYRGGLDMLVAQAWLSAQSFAGKTLDESEIERVVDTLEKERRNITLIGMPGCGKSTVSALLGKALDREVYDTDSLTEEKDGRKIPEIFASDGEEFFRDIESSVTEEAGKKSGIIISTGGGAVLRESNRYALKQNSVVIWLKRDLNELASDGRPLSKNIDALKIMEKQRAPIYKSLADFEVETDPDANVTLKKILEKIL